MPHLYGSKIMLREYRREDLSHITAWVNDMETTKYLSDIFSWPQTVKNSEDFLEMRLSGGRREAGFVIAGLDTQDYIGQADLMDINWIDRCATVGIVIAEKKNRGCGIGTEALSLILEYAFTQLGLQRVQLDVYSGNTGAIACYERAGFIREGVKRRARFCRGAYMDVILMSVLKEEWEQKRLE
jgi:RimJ/RimL family protein N-acetyltransferase